jgi:hypothetical protein
MQLGRLPTRWWNKKMNVIIKLMIEGRRLFDSQVHTRAFYLLSTIDRGKFNMITRRGHIALDVKRERERERERGSWEHDHRLSKWPGRSFPSKNDPSEHVQSMIMGNMTTFIFYKALFPMCTAFSVEKRNGRRRHGQRGRRSIKERIRGKHGPTTTTTYTVSSDAGKSRKTVSRHDSSAPPRLALDVSTRRWPSTMYTHTHTRACIFLSRSRVKKKKKTGWSFREGKRSRI